MATENSPYPMFGNDCPRCGQVRTTFDIRAAVQTDDIGNSDAYEAFLLCRNCFGASIGLLKRIRVTPEGPMSLKGKFANLAFSLERWVFEVPNRRKAPAHVPSDVVRIFDEGATCAAIQAWDAAGTMFRKTLDVATRSITPTPESETEPRPSNWKAYKDLRLRLDWLFQKGLLSPALKELSSCIHEDGNDAAHDPAGISEPEAQDLGDFCERVLECLYTVPGQIEENRSRRDERRGIKGI